MITGEVILQYAREHDWLLVGEKHLNTDRYYFLSPTGQFLEVVIARNSIQIQGTIIKQED